MGIVQKRGKGNFRDSLSKISKELSIFCKFERIPLPTKSSYFCKISAFIQLSRKARKMAKFKQNNSNNKRNEVVFNVKKTTMGNRKIGDARNILHAKSRRQMLATDARDKLAKLSKRYRCPAKIGEN